ncbi:MULTISPECIES: response regulator transcription factor [unclassified Pseudofrankia]|uniref:response regulator transcription factor n=1 Tax=unclassified Pseudofrankia TaxID=2994372 RepID=UPI0008D9C934|nr:MULTISPECIES: response regulator transcription factor [unclassified Pseudofrankia]MDT3440317.1 response regulator transcription factor [Pseudofrankia sp. BMG5.37]OHV73626.1 DNA-binding response regulator [Pseudofrankia sp. BMG5.36]
MSAAEPPAPAGAARARPRVVLADDAAFFREAIAGLLQRSGLDVVGEAGDPVALRAAVARLRPDVAVIDIRMPPTRRLEGLEAALAIRRDQPGVGVLLLSQYLESHYLPTLFGAAIGPARPAAGDASPRARAHPAGVRAIGGTDAGQGGVGYLLKERVGGASVFVDAVRRVAAGGCVLDPEVVALLLDGRRRRDVLATLSAREREVLGLMAEGRSNRAIGDKLVLTPRTVESHIRNIFGRLGLEPEQDDNRRVLAVLAYLRAEGR